MAGQPKTRAKRAMEAAAEQGVLPDAAPEPKSTTADAPPKPRARKADTPPRDPAVSATGRDRTPQVQREIEKGLSELFLVAGLGLSMIDQWDGQVIALNADRLAKAWADLAAKDARVRKALQKLLSGSAWGTAIGTTAMVMVPIAARHQYVPPEMIMMAAQNGVRMPDLQPVESPLQPTQYGPGSVGPEAESEASPVHPVNGQPVENTVPDVAPIFPRNTEMRGA